VKEQERNEIQKLLDSIPDELRVIENQISRGAVEEFYQLT